MASSKIDDFTTEQVLSVLDSEESNKKSKRKRRFKSPLQKKIIDKLDGALNGELQTQVNAWLDCPSKRMEKRKHVIDNMESLEDVLEDDAQNQTTECLDASSSRNGDDNINGGKKFDLSSSHGDAPLAASIGAEMQKDVEKMQKQVEEWFDSSSQQNDDASVDGGDKVELMDSNGVPPYSALVGTEKSKKADDNVVENAKSDRPNAKHTSKTAKVKAKAKDDCGSSSFTEFFGGQTPPAVVFQAGAGGGDPSKDDELSVGRKEKGQRKSRTGGPILMENKCSGKQSQKSYVGAVGDKGAGGISFDGMPNFKNHAKDNFFFNTPNGKAKFGIYGTSQTKPNYASMFKENRVHGNGFKLKCHELDEDDVLLDEVDEVPFVETYGYCLIGCFTGSFPGRQALDDLTKSWGVKCQVLPYGKGWTVFRFLNAEERLHVMQGGPYMSYGKTLMLKMVDKGILLTDDLFMHVPTWVLLHDVPLQVWSESGLSKISSKVGTPLFTDKITKERSKMNYARCLIEVDVSKDPILEFGVRLVSGRRFIQKVSYENYPAYCCDCKTFGHNIFKCPKHVKVEKERNDNAKNGKVHVPPPKRPPLPRTNVPKIVPTSTKTQNARDTSLTPPFFMKNSFGVLSMEAEPSGRKDLNRVDVRCKFESMPEDVSNLHGDATCDENMCEVEGAWQKVGKNGKPERKGGSPTSSISF